MAKQSAAKAKGKPVTNTKPAAKPPQKAKKPPVVEEDDDNEELDDEKEDEESSGKKKKRVLPDGTKQDYFASDGTKMVAVWRNEKLCCPTCKRKLPVTAPLTDAQRKAKAVEKKQALLVKGQGLFKHVADLLRKAAERAGEPVPTNAQIVKMMAAGVEETTEG